MLKISCKLIFILLFYGTALAQTIITTDNLKINNQEGMATFTGNVVIKKDGSTITSASMKIDFHKNGEKIIIDKVFFNKKISLTTHQETAYGNHGVYDMKKNIFYIYDDVILQKEGNIVKGDQLVYDHNLKFASLYKSSQNGRVRAILNKK